MSGINLSSQSAFGKKERSAPGVDKGLLSALALLILVAGVWGGERWYLSQLDSEMAQLDSVIAEKSQQMKGKSVDRVADFDARVALLQQRGTMIEPRVVLDQLELLTIPTVKLTEYALSEEDGKLTISGETDTFKFLAQQILSYRSDAFFDTLKVSKIGNTQDGKIEFSLETSLKK